jgi:hypothetical protein
MRNVQESSGALSAGLQSFALKRIVGAVLAVVIGAPTIIARWPRGLKRPPTKIHAIAERAVRPQEIGEATALQARSAEDRRCAARKLRERVSRQIDRKDAPFTWQVTHPQGSIVSRDASPRDCQSKSEPASILFVRLRKRQEHLLRVTFSEPAAVVFHIDVNPVACGVGTERDVAMRVSKLEGVLQQIAHCR